MMGAQDALYPPETAMPLARLAPGAAVEVVPSCGHLAPLETPEVGVGALNSLVLKG
jgi:pimeloyl-ACP methyl ester carboxylesterase